MDSLQSPTARRLPDQRHDRDEQFRQDFGVSYNGPIPGADRGMALSDKVTLLFEIQAVLRPDSNH